MSRTNTGSVAPVSRSNGTCGFSLIETVLALGIMGLAITALLGLLPHGIEMSRKAANVSAMSRIVDSIQSRLLMNSFVALKNLGSTTLHFDDQGAILEDGGDLTMSSYVVRVRPARGTALATLPGAAQNEETLLCFAVDIAATANPNFNFENAVKNSFDSIPLHIAPLVP
ncbi:MAG: Verru_Chthon cassette protein B [Verrucomicrobiaceae bacterium]|nr:Verru_Chthon cassette protein B [Verrucomicrobiaceae bacterium]